MTFKKTVVWAFHHFFFRAVCQCQCVRRRQVKGKDTIKLVSKVLDYWEPEKKFTSLQWSNKHHFPKSYS